MRRVRVRVAAGLLGVVGLAAGCATRDAERTPAAGAARYQLRCDSADTAQASTLFCVRLDTRNGDATVLDLDKLPVTSGASRAADETDGSYELACDATVTPQQSDFRCLRLHTRTGDAVMLRLSELPRWPR